MKNEGFGVHGSWAPGLLARGAMGESRHGVMGKDGIESAPVVVCWLGDEVHHFPIQGCET